MTEHIDGRRVLYDWAEGEFKSSKAVLFKTTTEIGNHYHLKKDEEFFLMLGRILEYQVGDVKGGEQVAPFHIVAKRGEYHRFLCEAGTILLSVATELYNTNDDYII